MGKKRPPPRRPPAPDARVPPEGWRRALQPGPLAPHAFPLSEFDDESLGGLAQILRVPAFGGDVLERLVQVMCDRERVLASLRDLPVQALLVLEVVAEAGGLLSFGAVDTELALRYPKVELPAEKLGDLLMSRGLCAFAGDRHTDEELLVLVTPSAELIVPAVVGVSLPSEPPPAGARSQPPRDARDMLALVTLTAHRRLRLTQSKTLDRAALKTFGKNLGPERSVIEHALDDALHLSLLDTRQGEQRLVPDAMPLLRYASGRLLQGPLHGRRHSGLRGALEVLPEGAWFPEQALDRWLARHQDITPRARHLLPERLDASLLLRTGLLEAADVGGVPWLRRRAEGAATEWRGDGHVTPSFEVMLGPAASLEVVAVVGLVAELVRLDHVLTFKLSATSVAAGMAAGVARDDMWRALQSVGPHGMPPNVEVLVRDWASQARFGGLEKGWFLFVPPEQEAALLSGPLAPFVRAVRAPGVLSMSDATPRRVLDDALAKLGIRLRGGPASASNGASRKCPLLEWDAVVHYPWYDPDDPELEPEEDDAEPPAHGDTAPVLPRVRPDEALRQRVQSALRDGFEPLRLIKVPADPMEQRRQLIDQFRADAEAEGAPAFVLRWFDALGTLWRRRFDELARWYERLPQARKPDALRELTFPLVWLPWLMLAKKWRKQALRLPTAEAVLRESARLAHPGRFEPQLASLIPILSDSSAHEWIAEKARTHHEAHPDHASRFDPHEPDFP
jgi:hypothetical protein